MRDHRIAVGVSLEGKIREHGVGKHLRGAFSRPWARSARRAS
jgi:hypothetical protein